jgi:hypothetical protein
MPAPALALAQVLVGAEVQVLGLVLRVPMSRFHMRLWLCMQGGYC